MSTRAKRTQVRALQRKTLRLRINACLAGFPGRDATPEQRRAWRDTFGRLTSELEAQVRSDLNAAANRRDDDDSVGPSTNASLQWTAQSAGLHTAVGPNTVTGRIAAAPDALGYTFNWNLRGPDGAISGGTATTVDAAKAAAAKAHADWSDKQAALERLDHHLSTRGR